MTGPRPWPRPRPSGPSSGPRLRRAAWVRRRAPPPPKAARPPAPGGSSTPPAPRPPPVLGARRPPRPPPRRNGDLPAVLGGIVDAAGAVLAPDPGRLPPDELDLPTLWRHPALLFAQSCWGPLEYGLGDAVEVIGQPSYDRFEGGRGPFYSSALVMRRQGRASSARGIAAPPDGRAAIPLSGLEGVRLAYNSRDSMSGFLALSRDLAARGGSLDGFARQLECGSHRGSLRAVADGRADL